MGKLLGALGNLSGENLGEDASGVMEKIVDAKRATFDETGNLRVTPATEIYEAVFENWQQVEKMSGTAELTKFLDPFLGMGDWSRNTTG